MKKITDQAVVQKTESQVEARDKCAAMLDINDVSRQLRCSARHVHRLKAAGRIPPPVKLGALVRWPRTTISSWIAAGCPSFDECSEKAISARSGSQHKERVP